MQENQYLSIIALGQNNPSFLKEISHLLSHHSCEIIHSHIMTHGQLYNLNFFIAGRWSVLAKLEPKILSAAEKYSAEIFFKRTNLDENTTLENSTLLPVKPYYSYNLYIVSLANAAGLYQLLQFLQQQEADITEFQTDTYTTRQTKTVMTAFTIKIQLAGDTAISNWREQFMLFCDDMNFDAFMEPDKN